MNGYREVARTVRVIVLVSMLVVAPVVGSVPAGVTGAESVPGGVSAEQASDTTADPGDEGVGPNEAGATATTAVDGTVQVDVAVSDLPGDGSRSDPYEISNASELQAMEDDLTANYTLGADINATGTADWNDGSGFDPIGGAFDAFEGTLDGNEHVITGLTINRSGSGGVGLFGGIGGTVSNATLVELDVTGSRNVGGLTGRINIGGVVRYVAVHGTVIGSGDQIGGLAGEHDGDLVVGSSSGGTVVGTDEVGGLVGRNSGRVRASYSLAAVSGRIGGAQIGGLAGNNLDTIRASYAAGAVNGDSAVGGLVGDNIFGGTVSESYWDTEATGEFYSAGGTSLTTAEMTGPAAVGNMTALDFSDTWQVRPGEYPGHARRVNAPPRATAEAYATLENETLAIGAPGVLADATDPDGDTHRATSVLSGPSNGSLDLFENGSFAYVPDAGFAGVDTFTYEVSDGNEGTDTATVTITVHPDLAPTDLAGTGTSEDPYIVTNASGLQAIGDSLGANYTLGSDIDASVTEFWNDGKGFIPIGNQSVRFQGSLDGANHTITNLTVDRGGRRDVGLFGVAGDGSVIEHVSVRNASVTGEKYVGVVAGTGYGTMQQVHATGTASATASGVVYAGGIVGLVGIGDALRDSYAAVSVTGSEYVGGLVGYNDGTVRRSFATGAVTGSDYVGGAVGYDSGSTEATYWDVNATGQSSSGGGTGLTTARMTGGTARTNMTGLAFPDAWQTRSGGYPGLAWQVNAPPNGTDDTYSTARRAPFPVSAPGVLVNDTDPDGDALSVVSTVAAPTNGTLRLFDNGSFVYTPDAGFTGQDTFTYELADPANETATATATITVTTQLDLDARDLPGSGTTDDPYLITNASELQAMEEDRNATYALGADIEAAETSDWNGRSGFAPVGNASAPFRGTLRGNGFEVSGLAIDRPSESDVGLFGHTAASALIRNLTLADVRVTGANSVGGLAGEHTGTIRNVTVTGTVTGDSKVGGLIGRFDGAGRIHRATSHATVTGTGGKVGGLIGLTVGSGSGFADGGPVTSSSATGNVTGGTDRTGGLIGLARDTRVRRVHATGAVTGVNQVGGLIGWADRSVVKYAYATGDVVGQGSMGGLIGSHYYSNLKYAYATGTVTPDPYAGNVGGLIGYAQGADTRQAYAAGLVNGTGAGLVGRADWSSDTVDSYWDVDATGKASSSGGTGVTTAEMTGTDAYDHVGGFDFAGSWDLTESYPTFESQDERTPATFVVDIAAVNDPTPGENLTVNATVLNTGDVEETRDITLSIDGSVEDTKTVTLGSNAAAAVNFTYATGVGDDPAIDVGVSSTDHTDHRTVETVPVPAIDGLTATADGRNITVAFNASKPLADTPTALNTSLRTIRVDVTNGSGATVATLTEAAFAESSRAGTVRYNTTWEIPDRNYTDASLDYAITVTRATDEYGRELNGSSTASATVVLAPAKLTVSAVETSAPVVAGETLLVHATVENVGDVTATRTVSLADLTGTNVGSTSVTLAGGDAANVTLAWDTDPGDAGSGSVAVAVAGGATTSDVVDILAPANVSVRIDSTNAPVVAGEELVVNATVKNTGDVRGSRTITVSVNGTPVATRAVTDLDGGDATEVTVSTPTDRGDVPRIDVSISSGDDAETVPVPVREPANLSIDVGTTNAPIYEGDELLVNATVENTGDVAGTGTIRLRDLGGAEVDSRSVTLSGGASTRITLAWPTQDGDEGRGSVTVTSPDDTDGVGPLAVENVLVVDPDDPAAYATIGEAVDNATTGERVRVENGTYNESVTLDVAGLSVVANGSVTLDANNTRSVAFEVGAPNVSVAGFRVTRFGTGFLVNGTTGAAIRRGTVVDSGHGVRLSDASDGVVSGSRVVDNNRGIVLNAGSHHNIVRDSASLGSANEGVRITEDSHNNTFRNNTVRGSDAEGAYARPAVEIHNARDNRIVNNDISANAQYGIDIGCRDVFDCPGRAGGNELIDNRLIDNGAVGIQIITAGNTTVVGNHIEGSQFGRNSVGGAGIWLAGGTNNTIRSNTLLGNGDGIYLRGGGRRGGPSMDNRIVDNRIQHSGEDGIDVVNGAGNVIRRNRISGNDRTGIHVTGSGQVIANNDLRDNAAYGIDLRNVTLATALADLNVTGNGAAGVRVAGHHPVQGENITFAPGTTVDFTASNVTVAAPRNPAPLPGGVRRYVDVANTTASPSFDLSFPYAEGKLGVANESDLRFYRYDGDWSPVEETTRYPDRDRITANLTGEVGLIALLGTASPPFDTTPPSVGNVSADAAGSDLRVSVETDERLADIAVDISVDSGAVVRTLEESAFTETNLTDGYHYSATVFESDGTYTATLREATDTSGNDAATGQADVATIDTRSADQWPTVGFDERNTGYSPGASGPRAGASERWNVSIEGSVGSSPAVANDTLYISDTSGNVYALDVDTGATRWQFSAIEPNRTSSPAVWNDTVYVGGDDGRVYALDADTGAERWTVTTSARIQASPTVAHGTVFVGDGDGNVLALDAATGAERWNATAGGSVTAAPAVANDTLYLGHDDGVLALDATIGAERWNATAGGSVTAAPVVANDTLYLGHDDGVLALDATTGTERWTVTTAAGVASAPAVANDTLYLGYDDGVLALDTTTGAERWNATASGNVTAAPVVANDTLYLGHDDGVLALDTTTGAERWNATAGGSVTTAPAVANETLYLGRDDGRVYALEPKPPAFDVTVTGTNAPVTEGETVVVSVRVTNVGGQSGTREVTLTGPDGTVVDVRSVTVPGGGRTAINLTWQPGYSDAGSGAVTIRSATDTTTTNLTVTEASITERITGNGTFMRDQLILDYDYAGDQYYEVAAANFTTDEAVLQIVSTIDGERRNLTSTPPLTRNRTDVVVDRSLVTYQPGLNGTFTARLRNLAANDPTLATDTANVTTTRPKLVVPEQSHDGRASELRVTNATLQTYDGDGYAPANYTLHAYTLTETGERDERIGTSRVLNGSASNVTVPVEPINRSTDVRVVMAFPDGDPVEVVQSNGEAPIADAATVEVTKTVSGTVTAADTGEPVTNATVTVEGVGTRATDAAGRYTFNQVLTGTYDVTVERVGYAVKTTTVDVTADGNTFDVALSDTPCMAITEPGQYELGSSVGDVRTDGCILVRASDVVFDGGGHAIGSIGDGATEGVRIEGPIRNVTVTNLTIRNWTRGVVASNATDLTLRNLTVTNTADAGVRIDGGRDVTIDRTRVVNGAPGMVLAANATTVRRVVVSSTARSLRRGIRSTGADLRVTDSVFREVQSWRPALEAEGRNATVENITVVNSDLGEGIKLSGDGSRLLNSTVRNSSISGWQAHTEAVEIGSNGIVSGNTLVGVDNAIRVRGRNTTVSDNTIDAREVGALLQAAGATARNNRITGNGTGIAVRGFDRPGRETTRGTNATVSNNTIDAQEVGALLQAAGATARNNRIVGGEAGITLNRFYRGGWESTRGTNATLRNNHVEGATVGIRLVGIRNARLRENAVVNASNGLSVVGSSTAAHRHDVDRSNTVDGLPIQYHVGTDGLVLSDVRAGHLAVVDAANVTIRNATVRNAGGAITLAGVTDTTVENLTARNPGGALGGVTVIDSSDTTVSGVDADAATYTHTIEGANVTVADIEARMGPDDGRIPGVRSDGISIDGERIVLRNATVVGQSRGTERLESGAGVHVRPGSVNVTIERTTIRNAPVGVRLEGTRDATVASTAVSNTSEAGIVVESEIEEIRPVPIFEESEVTATLRDPGDRIPATNNTLEDVTVRNTSGTAIELIGATNTTLDSVAVGTTELSLVADDVSIASERDATAPPAGSEAVGIPVAIRPRSDAPLELTVHYDDRDATRFVESTLAPYAHPVDEEETDDGDWLSPLAALATGETRWQRLDAFDLDPTGKEVRTAVFGPQVVAVFGTVEPVFEPTVESTTAPAVAGETLRVNASVANPGTVSTTQEVSLLVDGTRRDAENVTLAGGENATVELAWRTTDDDAGEHAIAVTTRNDSDARTVSVLEPANLTVGAVSADDPAVEGENATVEATIENVGDVAAAQTVTLDADGMQRDARTVSLGGGESTTVTLEWTPASGETGTYTIVVASANDTASTSVTVVRSTTYVDVNASSLDGNGTAGAPYVITNASELQAIEDDPDAHYELGADVNASGTVHWNDGGGFRPVGSFTGFFDGNNHAVSGVAINRSDGTREGTISRVGLFGDSSGRIANVTLSNVSVLGDLSVGGVVGRNSGVVRNVSVTGTVEGGTSVGGVAGFSEISAEIARSHSGAEVNGIDTDPRTDVSDGNGVGGLVGDNRGVISRSHATGDVTGNDGVGGIAGLHRGVIRDSYAVRPGSVAGSDRVGGIVGASLLGSVNRSYAAIDVDVTIGEVGGLVGSSGFEQFGDNTVKDSYWDSQVTGQPSSAVGGTALTTDEMTGLDAPKRMDGFDFDDVWTVTRSYPRLAHQVDAARSNVVVSVASTNAPVVAGERLVVNATVENAGGVPGRRTITLATDGTTRDTRTVSLNGSESTTVALGWTTTNGDVGNYTVTVASGDDAVSRSVAVREPANVSVSVDSTNAPVAAGETLSVNAAVENTGGVTGERNVTLIDTSGDEVDGATVELAAGESTALTLDWATADGDVGTGNVTIRAGNETASTAVRVTPAAYVPGTLQATLGRQRFPNGTTTNVTVEAAFTNGTVRDVTESATVYASDTGTATVDAGIITGESEGTVDVTADYRGDTVVKTVTIDPAAYLSDSLNVTLANASVPSGTTTTITARATFTNGTIRTVTRAATLTTGTETVATVAGDGTVVAVGRGTTAITATFEGDSDSETLTVERGGNVTVDGTATAAKPGENLTVTFRAENNRTVAAGAILNVTAIPDGFSIVDQTSDGGTWNSEDTTWLWQTIDAGDEKSPSLTLAVPENASGSYSVNASVRDVTGVRDSTSVEFTACRSLADAIDANDDGQIGNFEILDAIRLWRTGNPVPDTCGKTIDNFEILKLIEIWRS